jgi:hypothetical protein
MSPSQWGPPTWIFMHTLAEKIKEDSFPMIGQQLIIQIIQMCANLPCPDCASHAKVFWSKVKTGNVQSKHDLINLLFVFHNTVNKRNHLPLFKIESLTYYKSKNVIKSFNHFARNFNTYGNMRLINESFHRSRFLISLRNWLMNNLQHFDIN